MDRNDQFTLLFQITMCFVFEVFGLYDEATRKVFCVPVRKRNRATLVPLIKFFVPQGRRVTSDSWGAYARLRYEGYRHLVVVHKKYPYSYSLYFEVMFVP